MATPPRRRKRAEPIASSAIDIAFEAVANDPTLDSPARVLLAKQSRLVDAQRRNEDLGSALKVLTGLAGLAVAIALGVMVWQAKNANGLLIEPFSVPPDLAAKGLTGEAVASQVLDQLARMQTETNSFRKASSYANDWGTDIKVSIPTTGVSLGELQGALSQWLGHETRISGEVFRAALPAAQRPGAPLASQSTPTGGGMGLVVAVRMSGGPAFSVRGAETEIETLAASAAEQIFKSTQPYRYARWISTRGDQAGALATYQWVAVEGSSPYERAWGYRNWGQEMTNAGDPETGLRLEHEALRLVPDFSHAWAQIANAELILGRDEAFLAATDKVIPLMPKDRETEEWYRLANIPRANRARLLGDFATASRLDQADLAVPRLARSLGASGQFRALGSPIGLHDLAAARAQAARVLDKGATGEAALVERARLAVMFAEEDWAGLIARQPISEKAGAFGATPRARASSVELLNLAYARASIGDHAGAASMVADTPADCGRCLTLRGQLAAMAGDHAGAERWFAQAAKIAPSFPQPLFTWGQARLAKGDLAGALSLFRQAQKKGPGWADPYKFEGDVLVRQGKTKEARAAYAKAVERAPNWAAAREAKSKITAKDAH